MAVSLPPGLDYQQRVLSPTASSFVSREDLQCNWQDLPKFDVEPVELEIVAKKSSQDVTEENIATTKQPLNLSSLFMHQVGRKINQYKSLMGKSSSKKSLTNVASFVSMKDPGPSISRQASTKRKQDQYQVQGGKTNIARNSSSSTIRRSNLMFAFDDMTTDSTSVLKDFRHPSLSSINVGSTQPGPNLGRVISLNRSVSSATAASGSQIRRRNSNSKLRELKRQRYMSESAAQGDSQEMLPHGSKVFICSEVSKSGSSLCVSMDFGLAGAPTPIMERDEVKESLKTSIGKREDNTGETKTKALENRSMFLKILQGISTYLDLKLVKEPIFIIMVLSVMAMSVGVPHVLFFVPTYSKSMNMDIDPAFLLSATSVADLLGRIAFGFILDANLDFPKHVIYGLMIMAAGCSVIGLALSTNSTGMVISMLVYGLGSGAWFLMVPLLLSEYLGVERIGSSYGLIRLFQAASNLIGPVIGGVLSDQTGSFAASFVVMGLIMNLGAVVVFLKPIIERKSNKSDDSSQMSDDKQGCAE